MSLPRSNRNNPVHLVLLLSFCFFLLFATIAVGLFIYRSTSHGEDPNSKKSMGLFSSNKEAIGILEVRGPIMESKKILRRLKDFAEDDTIKAVVVRLDSPGGAVAPSQEIYQAVKKFEKPVIASMASVAASGAYYIASGVNKVYANAGTITGSIGVIMQFSDMQGLYQWAKIKPYVIKTGQFKDAGAPYRDMKPEERALLESMVFDVLDQFKAAVKEGRKMTDEEVNAVADGRIMSGQQAVEAKLVDQVGTLQDAIDEAAKLAKIDGKPEVVYPDRRKRPRMFDLMFDPGEEESSSDTGFLSALGAIFDNLFGVSNKATGPLQLKPGVYWLWNGS